jgi:hypothetical protein
MARVPQSGKKTFRVSEVITDHGSSLGKLMRRANSLVQIERLLSGCLNPELASHFQVATVRENRLILISPSASWATMLRMQAPQLIRSLQRAGHSEIEHIDIRVAPLIDQRVVKRKRRALSPAARQALDLMAHLEDDEDESSGSNESTDLTDGG